MDQMNYYIAVDLGAESGRVMLASATEDDFDLQEIHRFPNGPIEVNGSLRWDFEGLWEEIKDGIASAVRMCPGTVSGIGVDTWGLDFGLLDEDGNLLESPYHYRDSRTEGMLEKAFEYMDKRDIYDATGIQFMPINTVFQLLAMKEANDPTLHRAAMILWMADLISFYLCGNPYAEYTMASTGQLLDMKRGTWANNLFQQLGLPLEKMPALTEPGVILGNLRQQLAMELSIPEIPVIAVGSHDTASAVAAVPAKGENWAYLSSGTWSLMGVEIPEAIINDQTFECNFTNEGGVCNTIRLLKNIMGLWLVQECRRHWMANGEELSYTELTQMAAEASAFNGVFNTNDPVFLAPGDMPSRINEILQDSGQKSIEDKGQMIRLILENLALNYRWCLEKLESLIGNKIEVLHIVGGGIQNTLLCQLTADAIGRKVIAGPIEATAMGNVAMQAIAAGHVESLQRVREMVSRSVEIAEYQPRPDKRWDEKYKQFVEVFTP